MDMPSLDVSQITFIEDCFGFNFGQFPFYCQCSNIGEKNRFIAIFTLVNSFAFEVDQLFAHEPFSCNMPILNLLVHFTRSRSASKMHFLDLDYDLIKIDIDDRFPKVEKVTVFI